MKGRLSCNGGWFFYRSPRIGYVLLVKARKPRLENKIASVTSFLRNDQSGLYRANQVAEFLGECNFLTLENGLDIGVRPEALSVAQSGDQPANQITIDVETSVFVGSGVKLIGRYAGQRIVALVSNQDIDEPPEPGSRMKLAFDDRSVMRFS